ncbi:hypothetical protein A2210_01610 [Candidatus Woesebacteria bacterium RIFOXYA1_FULL_40_18]|uniref:Uncharacterized protein n=4 Tax=Candidatus Woeseibacteriota TaxID=1752722 RepID=A0A1F8CK73_9BACT|nr:MAG: hypothetical protein UT72_C0022G0007 [Candidatus Woesebacteria bacterium GW2011_GWB1_40_101]OGM76651.1 MAG: hypothetical protein A2210_01610 [Candidatus Woesebacteria bacterium RIFOXYA1_FULL_40_18]OGM80921.1 MAG: hypothetical protein A2361_01085 [Candidatus Woesebacteria bacterium RIFOXYB1_FULL_40_26]OGM88015.1 MAG: hypothetical protein A2614_00595 [Candidatus Woesebacteria bacterium RIFOXYD1_FULL_40_21]
MKFSLVKFLPLVLPLFFLLLWFVLRFLLYPSQTPEEFVGYLYWLWLAIIYSFIFALKLSNKFSLYTALFLTTLGAVVTTFFKGDINDYGEEILRLALIFWLIGIIQSWSEVLREKNGKEG